ncbi:DNA primase [Candidatus Uhrbacteria bacterium RIFCSPLOWO2_01_FULL_47_24]|uniref:DNA primase n=1 Tax=Candidatus Uhrbacteria bacterium RIFCSPLOWO2_01_FULL_47_24 TaxID=1802401 RepID=A0A1F7USZ2_9BACT|nr:MAG: DNA primase [Candidatus Uhrbacteria bacterium RIFCSPHIGHO2_01_FULL_47_11]OGL68536.1 MAG: DNA primase [Candidatus Uhrbacteria bacterium RIFCSPHIGHO2_02_FULL_46_47]OGL80844.1 MAG: DNA primase [Candidatus Uhrbacteria bacterium RIFCSPLOWO2_01_FULL_47_24]OGL84742.1 MAG: DNA primase [Candidatus Uhrbacteria bacterium RIFCSPLOWO2_02_FULL_46_25]OGL93406.1 MAG: DNA primase [Candidatus Uhrbacteria bacterium RIFCSPLOWO2_12_FULL_47_10]
MLSPVDEIKARLDLVDFVGTYVQLKRAGANFKANCPFHQEKTPSFMVSKPKQIWHCFGCNEGGDIFKFIMKIEGLDFPEALKILADKAGVTLPKYDARAQSQRNTLLEIVKTAAEFYATQFNSPRGQVAQEYLAKRGLSDVIIKQFGLGYAPDSWDTLATALRDKFKAEDVFAAGLLIRSERNQGFYDRFRHRIMFPIRDVHGNSVGFTSRLLDETRAAASEGGEPRPSQWAGGKYVNTPETMIYNKGRVLYGLDLARQEIRARDYAVIVEGNMDVIACHQFGMVNVIAASGTALTLDQARLLKRYTNNLMISFDADAAGEHAAKRGIDVALLEGIRIKVITIPEGCGKDADECVRKNIKAWEGAVRGAQEIMEYHLQQAQKKFNVATAQGRSQFVHTLLTELIKLPDAIEQDFWIKRIAEILSVEEKLIREQMRKIHNPTRIPSPGLQPSSPLGRGQGEGARSRTELIAERLLALFFTAPSYAEEIISTILPEMLSPVLNQTLYTQLVACYTAYNSMGSATADANFGQFWHTWSPTQVGATEILSTADVLELFGDKEFEGWDNAQYKREAQFLIQELRREYSKTRRLELAQAMRRAEKEGDQARVQELTREFALLD